MPRRVVTLTPSATELVAAAGGTETLVGVDDFSTYPPEVEALPRVGAFLTPNLEAILKLDPDLVITDDIHEDVAAALRDAGIESIVTPIHTLGDVRDGITTVAKRLGHEADGRAAIARIDDAIDAASARRHTPRPEVLAVIDHGHGSMDNIYAAGPGSWLDELLAIEGAANVLAASGVRYPKISPEEVLRTAPDVIVDVTFGAEASDWDDLRDVPAVRDGKVKILQGAYLLAPSPRVDQALADLERALYP